jgi:hypothetical protein
VETQVGSFGSIRLSGDFNQVVLPGELAFRISLLNDETKYRQEPAFRDDRRLYGAAKWKPRLLNKGSVDTTVSLSGESGRVDGIAAQMTPPLDSITPYFTSPLFRDGSGNLRTYTATEIGIAGLTNPWLTSSPAFASGFNYTAFEAGGAQGKSFYGSGFQWPDTTVTTAQDPTGVTGGYWGITTHNIYGNQARLLGSAIGAHKAQSLRDASIFNFYDQLIGGPNSGERNRFDTFTLKLSQTYLDGKVGFDAAYNSEEFYSNNHSFLSAYSTAISVDIMQTLPDGQANPNVGRPYVIGGGQSGYGSWMRDQRETARVTAYGELDFRDIMKRDGWLPRLLGRHVVTGAFDKYSTEVDARSYQTTYISPDPNNWQSLNPANASTSASENALIYLGGPVNGRTTASGLNLSPVGNVIRFSPTTQRLYNNVLKAFVQAPLNVIDNHAQPESAKIYASANLSRDEVTSRVVSWQAHLWDGALVPLLGYRVDEADAYLRQAPQRQGTPWVDAQSPLYRLQDTPTASVSGISRTASLVARLPEKLRERFTPKFELSLFGNQSENFQPAAARIDLHGNSLPSPAGKTREFGFTVNTANQKLFFKATRFKTEVSNASVTGLNQPLGGAIISYAWGQSAYYAFTNPGLPIPFGFLHSNYGTTSSGQTLNFQPAGPGPYSQQEIDAMYAVQVASVNAWRTGAQLPDSIQKTFGMTNYMNPASYASGLSFPPNLAVTADTVSEGEEFELIAKPIQGLSLSLNVSHVKAQQTNIGSTFVQFMEQTKTLFAGPAGDMQIFASNGATARSFFTATSLPEYNLLLAQQGSATSELRPWRFNTTGNYEFMNGALKGLNLGGSYRWEDQIITGYPVVMKDGFETYDIANPYKGGRNDTVDLWIGYSRAVGKKWKWRTQMNVRNVFARDELTVVTSQPDGSPAAMKIAEPRVISWSNSFEF